MEIFADKALVLNTRNPDLITHNIATSKTVAEKNGVTQVAVKWGLHESQKLAKLGFHKTPSPILRKYKWSGRLEPFAHQKITASFLTLNPRAFCFSEQGTGKTASVIWAADYLLRIGEIKRVLIVCPLSIMKPAWQADIFKFAMHRSCSLAYGNAATRKKVISAGAEFVVINFDGVAVVKDEIMNGGFDLIVIDECSSYKHANTNRWKVMQKVSANARWMWMLTGTPAAQSPMDAYGIAKLLVPKNVPKFYGHFRDKVMYKINKFKWLPRPGAKDYVFKILQPAIRFERDQCLDLPDVLYTHREAPLTPQQQRMYAKMKKDMLIDAAGEEVSAINAAVKINKLLQIACGSIYADSGEVIDFDVSNRLNTVLEVIEESSHKVLIFVPFNHTIDIIRDHLVKHKISCDVINGKVPVTQRNQIIKEFQTKKDPHVLVIQPQAAAHGLTLTEANTIIWYAPITSVETYLQANARINRPGQKNNMNVVHIHGSEIESKLYNMLENNILTHSQIVNLYKSEVGIT